MSANSADPVQTPPVAASELGLNCLHVTLKRIPDVNRVNMSLARMKGNYVRGIIIILSLLI